MNRTQQEAAVVLAHQHRSSYNMKMNKTALHTEGRFYVFAFNIYSLCCSVMFYCTPFFSSLYNRQEVLVTFLLPP